MTQSFGGFEGKHLYSHSHCSNLVGASASNIVFLMIKTKIMFMFRFGYTFICWVDKKPESLRIFPSSILSENMTQNLSPDRFLYLVTFNFTILNSFDP